VTGPQRWQHRGRAWTAERRLVAVPLSGAGGGLFGVLNAWAAGVTAVDQSSGVLAFLVGGVVGLITAPALMLVTISRDAIEGVAHVGLVTSAASILSGLGGMIPFAPICVYVVACAAWRCIKGGGGWIQNPGFCRSCGYDLTALAVPACPECGALRFVLHYRGALSNVQERHE